MRVERIVKACVTCGKQFEVLPGKKRSAKKFCSFECSVVIRRTLPECKCLNCGKAFQPRYADRMNYCSKDCKIEYKLGAKIERDNKANEERNNSIDNKLNKIHICLHCGIGFKQIAKRKESLYCSEECQNKRHANLWVEVLTSRKQSSVCKVCGKEFISEYGSKIRAACPGKCLKLYYDSMRAIQWHRRKRKLKHAYVAHVYKHKIFKRDSYTCKLCHHPLNMDAIVPHPLAATIDHIIPIANGGTHEPRNVQSAHFICNGHKGNKAFDVRKVLKYVFTPEQCKDLNIKPYDYSKHEKDISKRKIKMQNDKIIC